MRGRICFEITLILCLFNVPCLFASQGWDNVPEALKQGAGVEISNGFVYATGVSCIEKIRKDKAHEIAKKKSLLKALQFAGLFGNCKIQNPDWVGDDQLQFYNIFTPMAKKVEFQGTQVIRQWEKQACNYTTIAVPEEEVKNIPCEFTDIKSAVLKYLEYGSYSQSGLLFCLKNSDQYSQLRRRVETALEKLLIEKGDVAALFFSNKQDQGKEHMLGEVLIQNRVYRANKIADAVKQKLAQKGNLTNSKKWKNSLFELVSAIELAPVNGKPYLMLADWADNFYDPIVAKYASEKAMRDGIYLKEALTRKVSYLSKSKSDEKEVFGLLLSQLIKVPDELLIVCWSETWPKSWNAADKIIKDDNPVANLVAASLGQAVRGESKKPPVEFAQAVSLYNKANSNKDLVEVLKILFKACEKEPASPEVYNLIGACFRHMEQYEIALPFLWQALVLKPGFDLPLTNLGLCCEKLNLMKSAGYYFNHDAVVNSTNAWVNSSYAKFISRRKQ